MCFHDIVSKILNWIFTICTVSIVNCNLKHHVIAKIDLQNTEIKARKF